MRSNTKNYSGKDSRNYSQVKGVDVSYSPSISMGGIIVSTVVGEIASSLFWNSLQHLWSGFQGVETYVEGFKSANTAIKTIEPSIGKSKKPISEDKTQ